MTNQATVWQTCLMALAALALAMLTGIARADETPTQGAVRSETSREAGELSFEQDGVRVNGKRLRWEDLLTLKLDRSGGATASPHVVHLTGAGPEQWPGRIISFDDEQLVIDIPSLGVRTLPAEALVAIDFAPDLPWPPERRGVLFRHEGGPVPSTLTQISEDTLTLDSPLGELEVRRDIARRYAFDRETEGGESEHDTLTLAEGAVLHGRVQPTAEGVTIEHHLLGEVSVDWRQVQSLRRRTERLVYLADLEPAQQTAEPLLVESLPVSVFVERVDRPDALDAWTLQPKLRQVFALPESATADGGSLRFKAELRPMDRGRGAVSLRLLVDGEEVWEGEIAPDDEAQTLDVPLGAGRELALEVDYGEPQAFPLGVTLIDPVLMAE